MSELNTQQEKNSDPLPNKEGGSASQDYDLSSDKDVRRSAFKRRCISRKKQKQRDKQANYRPKMQPHWGESITRHFTPSLTKLAAWSGIDLSDDILREVEGLSALMIILTGANDYSTMSAGLFLYIREKFPRSISGKIVEYVQCVLNETFCPHSGQESAHDTVETHSSWVRFIKDIKENWTLCKGNRLFGQFSKIFGLLVTFGLCNADSVTFDIKGYKLIEPDLRVIHGDAQDIISACCDTVVFWVETCHTAWKTKSFTPFLLGNTDASNLDMEYHELIRFWDLARNGNLVGMYGVTDSDFVSRLEAMSTKLKRLIPTLRGLDKQVVERKFSTILSIINDHAISKMAAGYRRAPFAIEFFGPSSQGKTFCAEQITAALFASANIDNAKGKKFMFDSSKKHWDGARSDINHFIINDHGNVKSTFVEVSPCDAIQKICDNAPCVAPMADLARKEKTWLEPELVTVTTNVKDLDARLYSNCPYSIQRRMHVVIDVFAKDEYQKKKDGASRGLDTNKVLEKYTVDGQYRPPPFDDVWELNVSVAMPPANLHTSAQYRTVEWRGIKMERVDMRTVINYCIEMFHKHRQEQFDLVKLQDARTSEMKLCGVDGCYQLRGHCMEHSSKIDTTIVCDVRQQCRFVHEEDLSQQTMPEYPTELLEMEAREFATYGAHSSEEKETPSVIGKAFQSARDMVVGRVMGDISSVTSLAESAVSMSLLTAARIFVRRFDWVRLVPSNLLHDSRVQHLFMLCDARRLRNSYIWKSSMQWSLLSLTGGILSYLNPRKWSLNCTVLGLGFGVCAIRQSMMLQLVKDSYVEELHERNSLSPMLQTLRDENVTRVAKTSAIIFTAYTLAKLYKRWRALEPQGSLEPTTVEEVRQRDAEDNVWSKVARRPLPITTKSALSCNQHIQNAVLKNLVYGSVNVGSKTLMVNGLFVTSNAVLVPDHYFADVDNLEVVFRKENPDACGGKFTTSLHKAASVLLPGTDMRLCYSSTGGSFKNLIEYFPSDHYPAHNFVMLYRKKDGSVLRMEGSAKPGIVETVVPFRGGTYEKLTGNTFAGLCGATLVSRGTGGVITGVHLGGLADTPKGCYGSFLNTQLKEALSNLQKLDGVMITGSSEKFEPQVLGQTILTNEPIHKKNPMNFLPEDSQIQYYGSCTGRVKSVSRVKVTPISECVTDVCGVPNKWGPPKMHPEWFGWQTCLANLSNPGLPYPHDVLVTAVNDYKSDLLPLFQSDLWNDIAPLSDEDNVNGIPGMKFMDAIKINTSIGFPLSGCKSDYMEDVDVFDDLGLLHRKFKPFIMDEIRRCENCYLQGERAYPVAKACKKDEILAKEKCRIFYSNSIALTFLIRKYYLPVIRVMMMNPLKSECAVGINSHGPEWDALMKFLRSKDSEKFLAGDYSKFDQKLTSQILLAGLRIFVDFASVCPAYGANDLTVMRAMTGDIVYSVIAFDGNLIGLSSGGHISGNPLTAVLNSVSNSLNMRCCFHILYPEAKSFREACALVTYGDDNAGSVSPEFCNFNIKSCSEIMARYGQTYTMPDKESELTDYMDIQDLEFLKRKTVFHSALDCEVGALADDSCFKMLHCFLREKNPPLSEEEACAQNIDTALMEWFNHGEEMYERRRKQMCEVARKSGLDSLCQGLNLTYDDRVADWKSKYDPHSGEEREDLAPLYTKALTDISMKVIGIDYVIVTRCIGEIDMAFQTTVNGCQHILIVEIKDSLLPSARCKGRKQLLRITQALAEMNPKIAYAGVLLSPRGYEAVCMTGDDGYWEEIDLPFSLWVDVEQFEKQVRLALCGV